MKVLLLIAVVIAIHLPYSMPVKNQQYRFNKVQCKVSAKKTCMNNFCYVKSHDRYNTTLNIGCDFKVPLNKINIDHSVYFRKLGQYRLILKNMQLEMCTMLKFGINFPMYKSYMAEFQETYKGLIHECPYTSFKIYNFSHNGIDFSAWPSGEYKNIILLSNEGDSKILEVSHFATYISEDKSDF
ncbi:unnamed protein product [Diamesa serratosioi]